MLARNSIYIVIMLLTTCSPVTIQENTINGVGWIDNDTYMVSATGVNEQQAMDHARHQILKDIVDVRVRNKSRYTDIVRIQEEFEIPLRDGVIIKKTPVPGGIRIYFQIRDTDLRKKFMRY